MKNKDIKQILDKEYQHGFRSNVKNNTFKPGIDKNVIKRLSNHKKEPKFMLEWRLEAYEKWLNMPEPQWSTLKYPDIDYSKLSYYSEPENTPNNTSESLNNIDPEILDTYSKLGIPLDNKGNSKIAVDAIFDSVSIITTFKDTLKKSNIIFCPISEAIIKHPDLIKKYLGSVVSQNDNYFSTLNSAVFSEGSFVYIPPNVRCPVELSTYFRINSPNIGQFERTLIIADENSHVSYLEGCTAPINDKNQLHAAVVELVALGSAEIKYSTVQNWYPGDKYGKGGIYNFVTKRGICKGSHAKITWVQVETGASITWKYPSIILYGDHSIGKFHSAALTKNAQQADTGTKMIHIGKNTKSTISSKSISAGRSSNAYRGLVKILPTAKNARNFSQCDSLIIGKKCAANTYPRIENRNKQSVVEHEATISKISEEQLFYCLQRGIKKGDAISMIVNGFCKDVYKKLPLEFAVEVQKLVEINLENATG